jgi:hypothetical protein
MKPSYAFGIIVAMTALTFGIPRAEGAGPSRKPPAPLAELTETGKQLEAKYAAMLAESKAEVVRSLPVVDKAKAAALESARAALKQATERANGLAAPGQEVAQADGLVKHAHWWIDDAKKRIAKAQGDLKKATTDAARQAAEKTIDEQRKRQEAGEKALKEREAALERAKAKAATAEEASRAAQAALARAAADELAAAKALLADLEPFLSGDKPDPALVKATVLTAATPRGLAEFAQRGKEREALVDKLLADAPLMKEMLIGGGVILGRYGRAMEIHTAIQKASPRAREETGVFHRLALAVALELAEPAGDVGAGGDAGKPTDPDQPDASDAPGRIDAVKRYLAYEKAYVNGELDPAFKTFTTWEYRRVIDCEASDEMLAWGREMIRNYRPDFVAGTDYGWRYSALVRSDVKYGSQDVKNDRPELDRFQNILCNGGICGRRAFFGRFILRANGIPVWGVTQHKHAALSHWTPKGWVINLGAGFKHSWWDKGDAPTSGTEFLLETQARRHERDYLKVLRAQWVGRVLGEPAYNERRKVDGGFWSCLAHYQAGLIASQEVELGPLGQELAEANSAKDSELGVAETVNSSERQVAVDADGKIVIPAVAHGPSSGKATAMKSFSGGMQLLGSGGFKTEYVFDAPQAGKYVLSARVVTVHDGQKISAAVNDDKGVQVPVPNTIGMWKQTDPIETTLVKGRNVLRIEILGGSPMVLKELTLSPAK